MNSLVQEAPSIAKAIELAWAKAGEPQKFSVRIYEEPEKNFFGMVKKQAKIALLFEKQDVRVKQKSTYSEKRSTHKPTNPPKETIQNKKNTQPKYQKSQPHKKSVPPQTKSIEKKTQKKATDTKQTSEAKPKREIWSDEMVATGKNWMSGMLKTLGKGNVKFSIQAKRYHLKILLESPIAQTEEKEKMIFRNCAHLLMQTVRNKFKKQFRYHKVVISSAK